MPRQSSPQTPTKPTRNPSRKPQSGDARAKKAPKLELGSDFTPSPSPSSDDSRSSAFVPKDEPADLDDDIKADLSGEEDTKPAKKRKTTKNTPSPAKKNGGTKGGAWTGNEDWVMFTLIHPKVGTSWAAVAEAVGRDAKSCQNRYAVISKRLEPAIKSISGA